MSQKGVSLLILVNQFFMTQINKIPPLQDADFLEPLNFF